VFRFSPAAPYRPIHRFQHIYAPLTYFLVSLDWIFIKDFQYTICDRPDGFPIRRGSAAHLFELLFFKTLYIGYMIILPVLVFDHSLVSVLVAFSISHALIGITALLLFQTAHVLEGNNFPLGAPDPNNHVRLTFETTVDVAPRSFLLGWIAGGLNTHVAHHLFPRICHVHYYSLSAIIRAAADECRISYREYPNMFIPMQKHIHLLKRLADDT
jgi:linoleoyl-CoA desaturase